MNFLRKKFDEMTKKRLNRRFQKLVKAGLFAREVDAVKLAGEKRERPVLLCTCKNEVYAVVSVNSKKISSLSYFKMLGHYVQAPQGVVLDEKSDLIELHGTYAGYKAHLVIAQDVTIK